jgi:hypothetical protein
MFTRHCHGKLPRDRASFIFHHINAPPLRATLGQCLTDESRDVTTRYALFLLLFLLLLLIAYPAVFATGSSLSAEK